VAGNTLFVTDFLGGLHIADISDPAHTFEISSFETLGYAYRVKVVGDLAYVMAGYHLWMVDLSNPTQPNLAGVYEARRHRIMDVAAIGTTI
jgi:hypothetical protein